MKITIGSVDIGDGLPIAIQSMTTVVTKDVAACVAQICALKEEGCDVVRVAVQDLEDAQAIERIRNRVDIPIIADIHFDYRLALAAIDYGVDKIRINPGNIGDLDSIQKVVIAARTRKIPIRIGVNGGSLEAEILAKYGSVCAQALVDSVLKKVELLNRFDFYDIVLSVKSSEVKTMINAYRHLKDLPYPLHLGVTETGPGTVGLAKSLIGIGSLLADGIGDTVRVSLTADPCEEVRAAISILRALGLTNFVEIISCPTCGRCKIDVLRVSRDIEEAVCKIKKRVKIAVMGCVVNGIGEAKSADFGVAGGDGCAIFFEKNKMARKISKDRIVAECLDRLNDFI